MTPKPVLEMSIEHVDTVRVAGLTGRFDPSNYLAVSELWKSFESKAQFHGRAGDATYGVFRNRDFVAQSFEHLAGAPIVAEACPQGLEVWELPAREYLVFKQTLTEADLYPQIAAAQAEIWGTRVRESGRTLASAPDFQIYPPNFKVAGGWLAYYIPVL